MQNYFLGSRQILFVGPCSKARVCQSLLKTPNAVYQLVPLSSGLVTITAGASCRGSRVEF